MPGIERDLSPAASRVTVMTGLSSMEVMAFVLQCNSYFRWRNILILQKKKKRQSIKNMYVT